MAQNEAQVEQVPQEILNEQLVDFFGTLNEACTGIGMAAQYYTFIMRKWYLPQFGIVAYDKKHNITSHIKVIDRNKKYWDGLLDKHAEPELQIKPAGCKSTDPLTIKYNRWDFFPFEFRGHEYQTPVCRTCQTQTNEQCLQLPQNVIYEYGIEGQYLFFLDPTDFETLNNYGADWCNSDYLQRRLEGGTIFATTQDILGIFLDPTFSKDSPKLSYYELVYSSCFDELTAMRKIMQGYATWNMANQQSQNVE